MVARNQHFGDSEGWGELPPRLLDRLRSVPAAASASMGSATALHPAAPPLPFRLFRDMSRLALLFLGIALANMFVLLLALWVLQYGSTNPSLPILDPMPHR